MRGYYYAPTSRTGGYFVAPCKPRVRAGKECKVEMTQFTATMISTHHATFYSVASNPTNPTHI